MVAKNMECHSHKKKTLTENSQQIALIGNPNVGKSVIFGILTGKYVTVSNYPGTTVEVAYGKIRHDDDSFHIIDTPGVNTLIPMSEDEKVTRDILLKERLSSVVQVADAKNLRRALLITLQLIEMRLPFLLVLNMDDEARSRGIIIESKRLSEILSLPVIRTVATQRIGIHALLEQIAKPCLSGFAFKYDDNLENAIKEMEDYLPEANISKRSLAVMILAGDESLREWLNPYIDRAVLKKIDSLYQRIQERFHEPAGYMINKQRLKIVDGILEGVLTSSQKKAEGIKESFGRWSMHPVWGIPIILAVLFLVYEFVGVFGAQTLVNFLEKAIFGRYLNPWAVKIADILVPVPLLKELFVGDYGIITMALTYAIAIVLPIVGTFFIAFGILEDSGYLPRLAVMVNRVFKMMGLNGKAVLPMILGLGCDTMATLTARILETKKERIIVTLLLALGVPCSAQLGVILGMLAGLSLKAVVLWAGVIIGVIFIVGYLAAKIIPGDESDFVLELPPIRIPQFSNILIKTLARVEWYLKEAVPLFILGTLILFISHKLGLLAVIEKITAPLVVDFLGLPAKAAESFIIGFLRRDYGAAGLFAMAKAGELDNIQILVSLVTITLFVPCIANLFMIIKERGLKTAMAIVGFIFPFAFLVGGVLNFILRALEIEL